MKESVHCCVVLSSKAVFRSEIFISLNIFILNLWTGQNIFHAIENLKNKAVFRSEIVIKCGGGGGCGLPYVLPMGRRRTLGDRRRSA